MLCCVGFVDSGLGCIDGLAVVSGLIGRSLRLNNKNYNLAKELIGLELIDGVTCNLSAEPNVLDPSSSFYSAEWTNRRQLSQII